MSKALQDALSAALSGKPYQPPSGSEILISAFSDLSGARTHSANGPNPIAFSEIEAWARLMRMPLEPLHVRAIVAMDAEWMACAHSGGGKGGLPRGDREISAEAFDAMFA